MMKFILSVTVFFVFSSQAALADSELTTDERISELLSIPKDAVVNEFNLQMETAQSDFGEFNEIYSDEFVGLLDNIIKRFCYNRDQKHSNDKMLERELNKFFEPEKTVNSTSNENDEKHESLLAYQNGIPLILASMNLVCQNVSESAELAVPADPDDVPMPPSANMSENQREFDKNGFATVTDGEIKNLARLFELHGSKLLSFEEVKEKLTFSPQTISPDLGLVVLGFEPIGLITDDGKYQSVVGMYSKDDVYLMMEESDLSVDGLQTFGRAEPNVSIRDKEGLFFSMQGESSGMNESLFLWEDKLLNREYTVRMNIDADSFLEEDNIVENIVGDL